MRNESFFLISNLFLFKISKTLVLFIEGNTLKYILDSERSWDTLTFVIETKKLDLVFSLKKVFLEYPNQLHFYSRM